MPPPHLQPSMASVAPPQPYPPPHPQPPPSRPEKLTSLPRSAVPPPSNAPNPAGKQPQLFFLMIKMQVFSSEVMIITRAPVGMDTVIRELLPQQQPRTIERRDLQYITISKEELTSSDSLSPDPWKRDAREKAEKQQQLHIVDLLDKEIQELQVAAPSPQPWGGVEGLHLIDEEEEQKFPPVMFLAHLFVGKA